MDSKSFHCKCSEELREIKYHDECELNLDNDGYLKMWHNNKRKTQRFISKYMEMK
jgi:hypothetical protein